MLTYLQKSLLCLLATLPLSTLAQDKMDPFAKDTLPAVPTALPAIPTPAKPLPTIAPTPTQTFFELQAEMAERTFSLSPKIDNRALVVFSYEQAIARHCPRDTAICERTTKRIRELDGGNPIAACYHDGFASRACKELSAAQRIGWFDVSNRYWQSEDHKSSGRLNADDLDIAVAEKRLAAQLQVLGTEIQNIRMSPEPELQKDKLLKLYQQGISLTCRSYKLILEPMEDESQYGDISSINTSTDNSEFGAEDFGAKVQKHPKGTHAGAEPALTGKNPFDAVLNNLRKDQPTPTPTVAPLEISGPRYERLRLVPKSCYDFGSLALSLDNDDILTLCSLHGPYAARCIEAKRKKSDSDKPVVDGLSKF